MSQHIQGASPKARPILFSSPMIQALLEGRKSQTRRIVKPQPYIDCMGNFCWNGGNYGQDLDGAPRAQTIASPLPWSHTGRKLCPYGKPGDLLWVRETWQKSGIGWGNDLPMGRVHYRATDDGEWKEYWGKWKPSIHMPRSASRLTLELAEVRVERLQSISEADSLAEGATADTPFGTVWRKINTMPGTRFEDNPWIWALSFRVHRQNVDAFIAGRVAA